MTTHFTATREKWLEARLDLLAADAVLSTLPLPVAPYKCGYRCTSFKNNGLFA